MVLLLKKNDVSDLCDMSRAIKLIENAFLEQSAGRVCPYAPFVVGHDDRELRVSPGALAGFYRAGLLAGMSGESLIILFDTRDRRLLCIMAHPFHYSVRAGATVGLAVDRLADPDARRMVIIGTGHIARASLEAVSHLRKFERIWAFSRQARNREDFCSMAKTRLGIDVEAVGDLKAVVRDADVVIVATDASGPALRGAWLRDKTLVTTAGIQCEIEDEAYLRADLIVLGSREQERNYVGWIDETHDFTLVRLAREHRLDWNKMVELGDVIAGRVRPKGITIFRESHGGFGDLIIANWIYEEARRRGRGSTWDLAVN